MIILKIIDVSERSPVQIGPGHLYFHKLLYFTINIQFESMLFESTFFLMSLYWFVQVSSDGILVIRDPNLYKKR